MSSYVSAATDYAASFPAAQVALKMTDSGLDVVEDVLKKVGSDESAVKKEQPPGCTRVVLGGEIDVSACRVVCPSVNRLCPPRWQRHTQLWHIF